LLQGKRLSRRPDPRAIVIPADDLAETDLPAAAARRALFRAEAGDGATALAEVRRLLAEDPSLAYLRYVGARLGVTPQDARPDTAFAFAFQRAVQAGSVAGFEVLPPHGLEGFVARAGLTLITGGREFTLPPGAEDMTGSGPMRRFAMLTGGLTEALRLGGEPRQLLRLVSDMAASEYSQAA
jgi:hypothetical protein